MKLLFDQNLSPRLVTRLTDIYPGSSHVFLLGLDQAKDVKVWQYARDHAFAIVTKDADFGELSTLRGFPPGYAWVTARRSGSKFYCARSKSRSNAWRKSQL